MKFDIKDLAELIRALSSLLWPVLVFLAIMIFREQLRELLGQFRRMKRGKLFGQEIEFSDTLAQDDTSATLTAYLFPNGVYNEERTRSLNDLLRELGVERDVRLILDGAQGAAIRRQLIRYAQEKGVRLDRLSGESTAHAS